MAYNRRTSSIPGTPPQVARSQQTTQASFVWDMPRSAYAVTCQYNPNFIEFIKAKIPGSDRAYDPTTRTWYIKETWFDVIHELAVNLWPRAVTVVTREASERAWKEQEAARLAMLQAQREAVLGPLESALLDFCLLCDEDSLKACYRKMTLALHPDRGGDASKMAALNAVWARVEAELKKKTL